MFQQPFYSLCHPTILEISCVILFIELFQASLYVSLNERDIILNWDYVLELNHDIPKLFYLNIGSTNGASAITDRQALRMHEMSFQIPQSNFNGEDIGP